MLGTETWAFSVTGRRIMMFLCSTKLKGVHKHCQTRVKNPKEGRKDTSIDEKLLSLLDWVTVMSKVHVLAHVVSRFMYNSSSELLCLHAPSYFHCPPLAIYFCPSPACSAIELAFSCARLLFSPCLPFYPTHQR